MAGDRNANQAKTPWATLPGMLLLLSLAVYVMSRVEMASCLGTTSKWRSNLWSALVFALGYSNKIELLKVLILGFRACSWPGQQEGNGDTNSLFIFPWRQSLRLPLGEHCFLPHKTGRKVNVLFLLQAWVEFSAERATSFSDPESLKKEVCVRLCGWDFITAYSVVGMMVNTPSPAHPASTPWPQNGCENESYGQLSIWKAWDPFVSDQSKTALHFCFVKLGTVLEFPIAWIQKLVLCMLYDLASMKTGTAECWPCFKTWHNKVMTSG